MPFRYGNVVSDVVRDFTTYFYLGILVILGKITIGTFTQMLSAGFTFHSSMQNLIFNIQEIIKRTNYAYEYVKFMNYPAAIEKGTRKVKGNSHTIEFKNVSFAYPKTDIKVLDNVSITLKQGEHLSIVGLNGARKRLYIGAIFRFVNYILPINLLLQKV